MAFGLADNVKECFEPVVTSPAVPANSELTELHDGPDGLTIVLTAPDADATNYQIGFPMRLAYRVSDEGDRLRSMEYLDGRAATPVGRVEHSAWVEWFVAESLNIREAGALTHWCIVTPNDIVDVIAMSPPEIRVLANDA